MGGETGGTGSSGPLTDADIPDLNLLSTGLANSQCVTTDATGHLASTGATCGVGGGGGISGATNHGIVIATGTSTGTSLGVATNGQLPIGSTGLNPVPAPLTGTANQISVTNGAGSITLSIPSSPTLPGTTTGTFSGPLTGNASGNVSGTAANVTGIVGVVNGGHGAAPGGDDQVFVSSSTS